MRELPLQLERRLSIRLKSFFGSVKHPEIVIAELSKPAAAIFAFKHAGKTRRVGAHHSSVPCALLVSGETQIDPTVVSSVEVDVVDFSFGPSAGHPRPYDSVRKIAFVSDTQAKVSAGMIAADRDRSASALFAPTQHTSFGVIIENLAQFLRRNWCGLSMAIWAGYTKRSHFTAPSSRGWSGAAGGSRHLQRRHQSITKCL